MILRADSRCIPLADESVQCVVTSPPYWGLRDYGVAGQIGLEPTPDEYVQTMVAVFREVRRVLRRDGVCWVNLGDSYANDGKWGGKTGGKHAFALHGATGIGRSRSETGLKPKDLVGIPWRVAFALQADGWWLRQDCIWHKPNPMPESVTDRCTKAHEYVFLLSKSAKYKWNGDAVAEPLESEQARWGRHSKKDPGLAGTRAKPMFGADRGGRDGTEWGNGETRNPRSVWTIPTQAYPEAHFATFPEALAERCILAGSYERDMVFDPFGGSGTVGAVAKRLGRRWAVTELNRDYCRLAKGRVGGQMVLV